MNDTIQTIFGTAKITNDGYYRISSRKEGNHHKLLHRLIYEKFWGVNLPSQIVIHHKNGNKLDNCILNLEAMGESEHKSHHMNGKNNPNYGTKHELDYCVNKSKLNNTSGFFRVYKKKSNACKQRFIWCYQYRENGKLKSIQSTKIDKLKEKVLNKGLEWIDFNE